MKSYPVSAAGGFTNPAALDAVIVPPTINSDSLSSIVQQVMDGSDALLCVLVDFGGRKVRARVAAASTATAAKTTLLSATGASNRGFFTKDDGTKRLSKFTMDGVNDFSINDDADDAVQQLVKPEFPQVSTAQLLGRMEDALLESPVADSLDGKFVVGIADQGDAKVHFVTFDTESLKNAAVTAFGGTIGYDQTPTVSASATRQPLE